MMPTEEAHWVWNRARYHEEVIPFLRQKECSDALSLYACLQSMRTLAPIH